MSVSLESYAHKHAKDLMCKWAEEIEAEAPPDRWVSWGELGWRPQGRVFQEYPIASNGYGAEVPWDEVKEEWEDRVPTREELAAFGMPARAIVDVAIFHKGSMAYAIEIVHKHGLTDAKTRFLWKQPCRIITIPARWVLGQVRRPQASRLGSFRSRE